MASFTLCSMNNRRNTVKTHGMFLLQTRFGVHLHHNSLLALVQPGSAKHAAAKGAFQRGHFHSTVFSFFELQSRMRRP